MQLKISFLLQLSENDKRILIACLLVFILALILIGYLSLAIKKLMEKQGYAIDKVMVPLIRANMIFSPKQFRKIAHQKNRYMVFRGFIFPFLFSLLLIGLTWIYTAVAHQNNFDFFSTILKDMVPEFSYPTTKIFGITLLSDWPILIKEPIFHFTFDGILSYLLFLSLIFIVILFFLQVLGFVGRYQRIQQQSKALFQKNLNEYRIDEMQGAILQPTPPNPSSPQQK